MCYIINRFLSKNVKNERKGVLNMEIFIFIIVSIIYFILAFKVYQKNNSLNGLKASIILFILQLLSHIGNLSSNTPLIDAENSFNFIRFVGNLTSDIASNCLVIVSLIIAIVQYKRINKSKL